MSAGFWIRRKKAAALKAKEAALKAKTPATDSDAKKDEKSVGTPKKAKKAVSKDDKGTD